MASLAIAPTDPAQMPGECPETAELQAWIPYHSHCYYFEASAGTSWALASLECSRLGESLHYQLIRFVQTFVQNSHRNVQTLIFFPPLIIRNTSFTYQSINLPQ